jgi:hypothetical protein
LLEARFTQGSGTDAKLEARVDGGSIGTSDDGTSANAPDNFWLSAGATASGGYAYFDDVIALDSSTLPDAGQIEAIRADGDSSDSGEDEWGVGAGPAQTYDKVNEDPLDENFYAIESAQNDADHRQLWTLGTIASVGTINHVRIGIQAQRGATIASVGTINHVRIGIQAQRGAGSGTEHRIRSKVSTAENSADLGLTTSSIYYVFDPTTQPSNQSELDSYQTGVWRNDGGREFYCFEQWVMVDYTPGGGPETAIQDVIGMGVIPFAR